MVPDRRHFHFDGGRDESSGLELPGLEPCGLEFLYLVCLRISCDKGLLEAQKKKNICQMRYFLRNRGLGFVLIF